jgi:hypothetical protein
MRTFLRKHRCKFVIQTGTTVTPQPPYSPDLAYADFFLLPKLKSTFKGRRFDIQEIKENSLRDLKLIPKQALEDYLENWKKSWQRFISSGGSTLMVTGAINAKVKCMFYDESFLNTPHVLGDTTCTIY